MWSFLLPSLKHFLADISGWNKNTAVLSQCLFLQTISRLLWTSFLPDADSKQPKGWVSLVTGAGGKAQILTLSIHPLQGTSQLILGAANTCAQCLVKRLSRSNLLCYTGYLCFISRVSGKLTEHNIPTVQLADLSKATHFKQGDRLLQSHRREVLHKGGFAHDSRIDLIDCCDASIKSTTRVIWGLWVIDNGNSGGIQCITSSFENSICRKAKDWY